MAASVVFKSDVAFSTAKKGADRVSKPVTMTSAHYDKDNNTIRVLCDDGNARECRIGRLQTVGMARLLWKEVQALGKEGEPVVFVSAGGFDPNRWFYAIKKA